MKNLESRVIKSLDKTELKVDFEYLDQNNGAVIEIFHTGTKEDDLELIGKIKGSNIKLADSSWFELAIAMFPTMIFEFILILIKNRYISDLFSQRINIFPLNNTTNAEPPIEIILHNSNIEIIIFLIITVLSIGFFYIVMGIVERHLLLPKGLESFSANPINKNKNFFERAIQKIINYIRK
jgi:hypothetical protein